MTEIMYEKANLRTALLAARAAIAPDVRSVWDAQIGAHVLRWWESHPVHSLGVYWPMRGEPDLREAYATLSGLGVQLALPVVLAPDAPLQFVAWTPGDALVRDGMGVHVPVGGAVLRPAALLVPCVGFNAQGLRLGYGGGFYDRTLAQAPRPAAIGIGYACGAANFDGEAHDVPMDRMITELA
jgi:5-formyltetrahydrofolate cyclo-ligase